METKGDGVPSYPQPDLEAELVLPPAPTGYAAPTVRLAESTTSMSLWKLTWAWRQKVMGCLHIFNLIWK